MTLIGECPREFEGFSQTADGRSIPVSIRTSSIEYYGQPALLAIHEERGIATQAWSPLGGVYAYRGAAGGEPRSALIDAVITEMAERHGKTPAQIVLRWHIDSGRSAIPKSVTPARIAENLDVFDFALTPDDIAAINALDTGVRGGPNQDEVDFRTFDRPIPE